MNGDLIVNFESTFMKKSLVACAVLMAASIGDSGAAGATPVPYLAMTFVDYMPLALRTAKPHPVREQVLHAELGLLTEIGELADNVKKHIIYGKPFDAVNMMEEIADCCWYVNLWMHEKGIGAKVFDEAVVTAASGFAGMVADIQKDPWTLVEVVQALSGLSAALPLPSADRGFNDRQAVELVASVLAGLLHYAGYTLDVALKTNIDKLAKRYGDKYSDYMALNRDTDAERKILEGGPA